VCIKLFEHINHKYVCLSWKTSVSREIISISISRTMGVRPQTVVRHPGKRQQPAANAFFDISDGTRFETVCLREKC
jgi:hypothetical protein